MYGDQQNLKKRKEFDCSSNEIQGLEDRNWTSYENSHIVRKRMGENIVEEVEDDDNEDEKAARLFK